MGTPPEGLDEPDPVVEAEEEAPNSPSSSATSPPEAQGALQAPRRLMSPYAAAISLIMLFIWLIPIAYVGAAKADIRQFPKWLRHQQRISCLFIDRATSWSDYYIQVQSADYRDWTEIPEEGYFDMPVFGFRSRLHRTLGHSYRKSLGTRRINEAARFIEKRYRELNPGKAPLTAVRFARLISSSAHLAKQSGQYQKPPLQGANPKNVRYFGELRFDGKRARHPGNGTTRKRSPKPARPPSRPRPIKPTTSPQSHSTSAPRSVDPAAANPQPAGTGSTSERE